MQPCSGKNYQLLRMEAPEHDCPAAWGLGQQSLLGFEGPLKKPLPHSVHWGGGLHSWETGSSAPLQRLQAGPSLGCDCHLAAERAQGSGVPLQGDKRAQPSASKEHQEMMVKIRVVLPAAFSEPFFA